MVHYIRFLRTPQVVESTKKTFDVSAVLAVTTDLGDALFPDDVQLEMRLVEAHKPFNIIHATSINWISGSRALKAAVSCDGKYRGRFVRLHITTKATIKAHKNNTIPEILDVWSLDFCLADKKRAEPVVERELWLPNKSSIRIQEETGDSIARHIWDASLGFLAYFKNMLDTNVEPTESSIRQLINSKSLRRLNVLELGAGCGIVGIAFAQLVKCDMLLTDLEDASDILNSNKRLAKLATGSVLETSVLDWSLHTHDSFNSKFDLILVSDCIYNPDSSVHLVDTLTRLTQNSSRALILVGFKRRHENDTVFFDCMQQAEFRIIESNAVPLPHYLTEHDVSTPAIEFFVYQAAESLQPQPDLYESPNHFGFT